MYSKPRGCSGEAVSRCSRPRRFWEQPLPSRCASAPDQTQFSVTAGALAFSTTPALPALGAITLNGAAQTTNSTMTPIGVTDASGAAAGWNVTVIGDTAAGKSPVFAQYCLGTGRVRCGRR